jgi:hypothetical protein
MNKNSNLIISIVIVLVVIGLISWAVKSSRNNMVNENPIVTPTPIDDNATQTFTGTYVCLPHRDTSGPTTLECAFGLQTDDGSYYALDMTAVTILADSINTEDRVRVEGRLMGPEFKNTNTWNIYNIVGGIKVVGIEKI